MLAIAPSAPRTLEEAVAPIKAKLDALDESSARAAFGLEAHDELLKSTVSLCPVCLSHAPALAFRRGRRVLMHTSCGQHGLTKAVLENDERYYHLSNRDRWGRRYAKRTEHHIPDYTSLVSADGSACCADGSTCDTPADEGAASKVFTPAPAPYLFADQSRTKSCTVLVEVTDACNLACPVCYADAKGDRMIPLAELKPRIERLVALKGVVDSVQVTGGEATMHPEFWGIVEFLYGLAGVSRVYIPTNGIAFAKSEFAEKLRPYRDKAMVLLQYDGQTQGTDAKLRDAKLHRVRAKALKALEANEIAVQLTMTLAKGVNLDEVASVVRTAREHSNVRLVALQPATYSGRYDLEPDPTERLTLSDLVKEVARHAELRTREEDFVPIPCSHPGCGWITLYYQRAGLKENVMKYVDVPKVLDGVAAKTVLNKDELRAAVGTETTDSVKKWAGKALSKLVRPKDIFTVAIKPFMDRHSYDLDRISSCCHHTMDTKGHLVSFCEYNARIRPQDSWSEMTKMG